MTILMFSMFVKWKIVKDESLHYSNGSAWIDTSNAIIYLTNSEPLGDASKLLPGINLYDNHCESQMLQR